MFILWRHILRVHVIPFFFATLVLMFIFLLQFIMKFMDQLAGKGLSAMVIAELIVLNLAWMVVLAVPMGVLVAVLMGFGGLASANEITAMRASGVSLYRMIAPVLVASIVVGFLLIQFNNEILPDANHKAKILTTDIYRKKPTLSLVPGLFSQNIPGYSILVRKTFEHSNDLEGVTILDYTKTNVHATVTARFGSISFSPDYRKLIMDLRDGEIHEVNVAKFNEYRKIRFEKHRIAMNAEGFDFQRSQESAFSRGDRELSAHEMQLRADSLRRLQEEARARSNAIIAEDVDAIFRGLKQPEPNRAAGDSLIAAQNRIATIKSRISHEENRIALYERQIREYLVEIHKKYAIPVACVVFVLIGAPLGIMSRRGTFGVAASISLGFFLLYWACLIGGEKLADRGYIDPWFGMWVANIVLGVFGVYLTIRTARENLTIDWSRMARLVPKQWRSEQEEQPAQ
ncbi:MAG TPA: LptF/LptG family permease [Bacteroidota bacterium]|nr:LptF/LptG family permease [Bacteroidota bacterium]